jgi:PilZ domain-containing protein
MYREEQRQMRGNVVWDELGIDTMPRRREMRRAISIPIEVTGFAKDGKFFAERTVTTNVSESGCSFRLQRDLERGGIVSIKVLAQAPFHRLEDEPLLYQVAHATQDACDWAIGTAKLQAESVWSEAVLKAEEKVQRAS